MLRTSFHLRRYPPHLACVGSFPLQAWDVANFEWLSLVQTKPLVVCSAFEWIVALMSLLVEMECPDLFGTESCGKENTRESFEREL
jgi:hypothetical protein